MGKGLFWFLETSFILQVIFLSHFWVYCKVGRCCEERVGNHGCSPLGIQKAQRVRVRSQRHDILLKACSPSRTLFQQGSVLSFSTSSQNTTNGDQACNRGKHLRYKTVANSLLFKINVKFDIVNIVVSFLLMVVE